MKDKLKWLGKKTLHITISFIIGVIVATIFHEITTNNKVRTTAEAVCTVFGRDEQECKNGIDSVLDVADNEMQNTMAPEGGK